MAARDVFFFAPFAPILSTLRLWLFKAEAQKTMAENALKNYLKGAGGNACASLLREKHLERRHSPGQFGLSVFSFPRQCASTSGAEKHLAVSSRHLASYEDFVAVGLNANC